MFLRSGKQQVLKHLNKRFLHGKNFIGNELSSLGVEKISTRNNNVKLIEATEEEINKAMKLAKEATPIFRKKTTKEVYKFLQNIKTILSQRQEPILAIAGNETGLAKPRLAGEFQRTLFQIQSFSDAILNGAFTESRLFIQEGKSDLRRTLIPIGPVGVFGASNFPFAYSVAGGDTISALATKNPVIHKAHPAHIGTCELVAEAIQDAVKESDMPEGTFSMLHGEEFVGGKIVSDPTIKGIGFTGSIPGGRALLDIASKRKVPIPVYAEMGSVNPICVFPDYLKKNAKEFAKSFVDSFTNSCGQFCTNPGLLFVLGNEGKREFFETLKSYLPTIPPHRMLTTGIRASFENGFKKNSSIKGVEVFHKNNSKDDHMGAIVLKTNSKIFSENSEILSNEIFGPITLVVECETLDDLKTCYSKLEGQLSTTLEITENDIKTNDMNDILDFISYNVGRVLLNGVPTGLEVTSAMHHGGPYPACSDIRSGAVGPTALSRWVRPICYQNFNNFQSLLPSHLRDTMDSDEKISIREENEIWKIKN
eukprot:gene20-4271_t